MNIDERIEALTQSVELLATLHKDLEVKTDQRMNQMIERMNQMIDAINKLGDIAGDHEHREENEQPAHGGRATVCQAATGVRTRRR